MKNADFVSADKKFYQRNALGLLLSALVLATLYPVTNLDQVLIKPYFDVATQHFSLKHHYFLEDVMHLWLRNLLILIAILTLILGLLANRVSLLRHRFYQQSLLTVFIAMVCSTTVVAALKSVSIHACPNDLSLYGGHLPLLGLFDDLPRGVSPGHCFPGGHASGGFALMAFYFGFRQEKPRFAKVMLFISILLGFAMGWGQMMRGEHFLSHNLWSAWWVWLVCLFNPATLLINRMKVSSK